jgi:Mor family transcriptional regulator
MAEKCSKIVLKVKQKLKLTEKFDNGESVTKLTKDYGLGIQTVCDVKNNSMKLMEFVRDCDGRAGPSV